LQFHICRNLLPIAGPFWISVSLIFSTAICGNLAKYIETSGDVTNHQYGSDFRLASFVLSVTGASTIIFCYVVIVPFLLYSLLWYRKSDLQYSYIDILCAYGYSLSIFIPVSVLWVLQAQWFRWMLIIVSVVLSGSVLANMPSRLEVEDMHQQIRNIEHSEHQLKVTSLAKVIATRLPGVAEKSDAKGEKQQQEPNRSEVKENDVSKKATEAAAKVSASPANASNKA
uniref:Protein YIPF n=1 Tax=Gongylonema pulchrum TaxID=637853 RepID=A0A183ELR3_9BILA